jgi:two-component system response regulator DctR
MIHLVEDNFNAADAVTLFFSGINLKVLHYPTGSSFLSRLNSLTTDLEKHQPGCILLDIDLGDMLGIDVFKSIMTQYPKHFEPVIFLTGHGDMNAAIDMLKLGAFDFIPKPYKSPELAETVNKALAESVKRLEILLTIENLSQKLSTLTQRESEIMYLVISGLHNKEIAEKFGNSVRTVEIHRAKVFDKMKVSNAIELAKILEYHDLHK